MEYLSHGQFADRVGMFYKNYYIFNKKYQGKLIISPRALCVEHCFMFSSNCISLVHIDHNVRVLYFSEPYICTDLRFL